MDQGAEDTQDLTQTGAESTTGQEPQTEGQSVQEPQTEPVEPTEGTDAETDEAPETKTFPREQLPELGETVRYIRVEADGEVKEGEGVVHALFIGADGWAMVRVQPPAHADGTKASPLNIDYPAINPTEEEKAHYIEHIKSIRAFADASNESARKIVEDANRELEAMN